MKRLTRPPRHPTMDPGPSPSPYHSCLCGGFHLNHFLHLKDVVVRGRISASDRI
ncbi:hypothetical protein BDZ97DRAFT_1832360, partial [Flammula alnicola]